MSTNSPLVRIKGQKEGLWIFLDAQLPIAEALSALDAKLAAANNFFAGAEVILHIGDRALTAGDHAQLAQLVEQKYALHIKEIERADAPQAPADDKPPVRTRGAPASAADGKGASDDEFMRSLDETFRIPLKQKWRPQDTDSSDHLYANDEQTLYFRGTVRSGQMLEFPGNIVILGDVNSGAYVVASGDIIVMGRLHGVVHAGAEGEDRAVVIGAGFFPSQLRIAQYIGRPPDEYRKPAHDRARTEKASIKDGAIVIEPIL